MKAWAQILSILVKRSGGLQTLQEGVGGDGVQRSLGLTGCQHDSQSSARPCLKGIRWQDIEQRFQCPPMAPVLRCANPALACIHARVLITSSGLFCVSKTDCDKSQLVTAVCLKTANSKQTHVPWEKISVKGRGAPLILSEKCW